MAMTNFDAGVVLASAEKVVGDLKVSLTTIETNLAAVRATYAAAPTTFVDTQANVDALDDVIDAITALTIGSVEGASVEANTNLQATGNQ